MENNLTWQEFERVSMHVGMWKSKIFGGPKTSYQLTIDFGETIELENFGTNSNAT
jgi:tRNA-binding protein